MTFTVTPSLPDKGVPYRFEAFALDGFIYFCRFSSL